MTEAQDAANLLHAWSVNDFDGFLAAQDSIDDDALELIDELRRQEGDARNIQTKLEVELQDLAGLVRGALYVARQAIELALDPPASRFVSREELLNTLVHHEVETGRSDPG